VGTGPLPSEVPRRQASMGRAILGIFVSKTAQMGEVQDPFFSAIAADLGGNDLIPEGNRHLEDGGVGGYLEK
jgi:hypothetical protein